jgi:hypothetical protein
LIATAGVSDMVAVFRCDKIVRKIFLSSGTVKFVALFYYFLQSYEVDGFSLTNSGAQQFWLLGTMWQNFCELGLDGSLDRLQGQKFLPTHNLTLFSV